MISDPLSEKIVLFGDIFSQQVDVWSQFQVHKSFFLMHLIGFDMCY